MKSLRIAYLLLSLSSFEGQLANRGPLPKMQPRRADNGLGSIGNLGGLGGGGGGLGNMGSGGLSSQGGLGNLGSGGLGSFGGGGLGNLGGGGLSGLGGGALGNLGGGGLGIITGAGDTSVSESTTQGCTQYKIVSARGTGELQGGHTGSSGFVSGVLSAVPGGAKYEIRYPASTDYVTGPAQGAEDAINYMSQQNSHCPKQLYVLNGYSEGAMVITQLMNKSKIPSSLIVAIVLYGNPYFRGGSPQNACSAKSGSGVAAATGIQMPSQYSSIVFDCCASGDMICQTTGSMVAHLSYPGSRSEKEAVAFATSQLRHALSGGASQSATPTSTDAPNTAGNGDSNNNGLGALFPSPVSGGFGGLFGSTGGNR